MMQQA
jgi:hypothetical protein